MVGWCTRPILSANKAKTANIGPIMLCKYWRIKLAKVEHVLFLSILFGFTDVESGVFFTPSPCTVTRGHKYKLYKSHNNLSIQANFFTERVISVWNDLPASVNFSSFLAFKRCIEQVNFDCAGLIFR